MDKNFTRGLKAALIFIALAAFFYSFDAYGWFGSSQNKNLPRSEFKIEEQSLFKDAGMVPVKIENKAQYSYLNVQDINVKSERPILMNEQGNIVLESEKWKDPNAPVYVSLQAINEIAKAEFDKVGEINLSIDQGTKKAVYTVSGQNAGKLLWIIPFDFKYNIIIDGENGEIIKADYPWYKFLLGATLAIVQESPAQPVQFQAAQTSGTATICTFTRSLYLGVKGDDVKCLQQYLNNAGYTVAISGAGSMGNETNYFGTKTKAAVAKWQAANGVSPAAGYFGAISRAKYLALVSKTASLTAQQAESKKIGFPTEPPKPYVFDNNQKCSDGTKILSCSATKPKLCLPRPQSNQGFLVDNCDKCGCSSGTCVSPRNYNPKALAEKKLTPNSCTTENLSSIPKPSFSPPPLPVPSAPTTPTTPTAPGLITPPKPQPTCLPPTCLPTPPSPIPPIPSIQPTGPTTTVPLPTPVPPTQATSTTPTTGGGQITTTEVDKALSLANVDDVWQLKDTKGNNLTGKGITIAIIDSGIDYTHPDFGSCTLQQVENGNCEKIKSAYNFLTNSSDVMDDVGHGTFVAGVIVGSGAASNGKYRGVAPEAKLLIYKVGSKQGVSPDFIAKAFRAAMDPNADGNNSDHVDIISISIDAPPDYLTKFGVPAAIKDAVSAGVTVVAAAGNFGDFNKDKKADYATIGAADNSLPSLDYVLTVGAATKDDKVASYSSRGPAKDLSSDSIVLKPNLLGVGGTGGELNQSVPYPEIVSTLSSYLAKNNGCIIYDKQKSQCLDSALTVDTYYIRMVGTSFAAPFVAGIAGLVKQAHSDWGVDQIKQALTQNASDTGEDVLSQGSGRVDALAAVKADVLGSPVVFSVEKISADSSDWLKTLTIKLKNLVSEAKNFSLSVDFDSRGVDTTNNVQTSSDFSFSAVDFDSTAMAGLSSEFSSNQKTETLLMSLQANSEASLDAKLKFKNSVLPDNRTYGGTIVLDSGQQKIRYPFLFYKGNVPYASVACFDGTPVSECSNIYKGLWCGTTGFTADCVKCGCPSGRQCLKPDNRTHSTFCLAGNEVCPNGTKIGQCSGFLRCIYDPLIEAAVFSLNLACSDCTDEIVKNFNFSCPEGTVCTQVAMGKACTVPNLDPATDCIEGTPKGSCSSFHKGWYCAATSKEGGFHSDCAKCGCAEGYECNSGTDTCYLKDASIECQEVTKEGFSYKKLACHSTTNSNLYSWKDFSNNLSILVKDLRSIFDFAK